MIGPSIIKGKFVRGKNKSLIHTKLWDETEEPIKTEISKDSEFAENEVPIINYFKDIQHWWLLTNKSLFVRVDTIEKYKLNEIRKVSIDELFIGTKTKMEISSIEVFTNENLIQLPLELRSWPVMLSIFQFIVKKFSQVS